MNRKLETRLKFIHSMCIINIINFCMLSFNSYRIGSKTGGFFFSLFSLSSMIWLSVNLLYLFPLTETTVAEEKSTQIEKHRRRRQMIPVIV